MTPTLASLILLSGIALLGTVLSAVLALRLRKLARVLKTREAEETRGESGGSAGVFAPVLRRTDLHLRLHQRRKPREMPERYRFIRTLADRGVPAAEIAGILNLAPGEVEQLMSLSRVGRKEAPAPLRETLPKKEGKVLRPKDFSPSAETIII